MSRDPAATDRGMWRVVARRDFVVRIREKGFLISTALTLGVLTVFVLIRAYGGGGAPSFDLGLVGSSSQEARATIARAAAASRVQVALHDVATTDAAKREVASGTLDAALIDGAGLVGNRDVDARLAQVVESALIATNIQRALAQAGVSPGAQQAALNPAPVTVTTLLPSDPNRGSNSAVAFVVVLLLYGQLFGYGIAVATGVIEEKSSRIVEILLSSIRPRELLTGKVVGVGALGLLQLACVSTYAIVLAGATGVLNVPAHAVGTALMAVGWFVLGFAFYASLFAVAGSLVSRMEELQNAIVPINLLILASFFVSIGAVASPDTPLAVAASLLPFSSALAMPVRIAVGAATGPQIVAALLILVGSVAVMLPLAGRLYANAVLQTGARVRLRDVWRTSRQP